MVSAVHAPATPREYDAAVFALSVRHATVSCLLPPGGNVNGLHGVTVYPEWLPSPPHAKAPTYGLATSADTDPRLTTCTVCVIKSAPPRPIVGSLNPTSVTTCVPLGFFAT